MKARTVHTTDDPGESLYRSRAAFACVFASLAVLMMGPNLPTPLYPAYRAAFHLSPLQVTLLYAVYAGALIPALLLFGPLSDAIGRRPVLYAGLAVGAAGSALLAFAPGAGVLFAGRVLQGISVGAASGAATAALRETEPDGNGARAATFSAAALVGGSALGPLFAGLLVQYAPFHRELCYLAQLGLLAAGAAGLLTYREPRRAGSWKPQRPGVPPQMRGLFAAAGGTAFLVWAITALFLSLVPAFILTTLHTSSTALSGGAVTIMLGTSALVQLTCRTLPALRIQVVGMIVIILGLIALNVAGVTGSLALLLVASIVAGAGQGLAFLGAMREVTLAAPAARLGEVISGFYVVVYVGVGGPVIGVGLLATHIGLLPAVHIFSWIAGVLGVLIAVLVALYARRRARPESAVAPPARAATK